MFSTKWILQTISSIKKKDYMYKRCIDEIWIRTALFNLQEYSCFIIYKTFKQTLTDKYIPNDWNQKLNMCQLL